IALFGEKYEDKVRMVKMGDYSLELCGGTHVHYTGEIGIFKIVSQSGIGSGLRRIEALTGQAALDYLNEYEATVVKLAEELKTSSQDVEQKVKDLLSALKEKDRIIQKLREKLAQSEVDNILAQAQQVEGVNVLAAKVDAPNMDSLRSMADLIRNKLGSAVIVLGSDNAGKVNFVTVVTNDLLEKGLHAGKLIKEVAKVTGGGGGGRPEMAQAGGKNPAKISEALNLVIKLVESQLKNVG
ncbi:MAG TPA: alanine--tRNA ligase, partial [Clostridia bacterium]|nr:alanine--tRNA ligase [Clostridia bacterium]